MTYTSCISHPANEPLAQVHPWQLVFCEKNQCAAFLLSNFEHWHNWKLRTDAYNKKINDIAEQHNEPRRLSEDVWLFKSLQGLSDSILNLFGVKTINEALKLLEKKGVISIQSNPSKNHCYDKRKYFRFYPEVCTEWMKNHYLSEQKAGLKNEKTPSAKMPSAFGNFTEVMIDANPDERIAQPIENIDTVKVPNALGIFADGIGKNADTQGKSTVTINEININKKLNNSTNAREGEIFLPNHERKVAVNRDTQPIVDALIAKGMSRQRFFPDTFATISHLLESGATTELFCEAYDKACLSTHGNGFGIPYLVKIITEKLEKKAKPNKPKTYPNKSPPDDYEPVYENDFKNGLDWMGDLI